MIISLPPLSLSFHLTYALTHIVFPTQTAVTEAKRVLKRLAKPEKEEGGREAKDKGKELMKPYARMLAKVRERERERERERP